MYKITGSFRGKPVLRYRKTDRQSKLLITELRQLGVTDIGMVRVSPKDSKK